MAAATLDAEGAVGGILEAMGCSSFPFKGRGYIRRKNSEKSENGMH
jgi:hypothetical protein